MFAVATDPLIGFVDAVRAALTADTTLSALVTGVYGHVSEAARVAYPYLVLGRRSDAGDAGAMGVSGHRVTLQIDGWSDAKGPYAIEAIGARVFAVLERRPIQVGGFEVVSGSLHREMSEVFDEPDEDKPGARLYRLVQMWSCEIHGTH